MVHILVSACLLGENCKWDGGNNRDGAVLDFLERNRGRAQAHPVCPERLGGLPTPRPAAEINAAGRVVNMAGADVTEAFLEGAGAALRAAEESGCVLALLKERSPSCGLKKVYDGSFSHRLVPGMGKTAEMLRERGILALGESEIAEAERFLDEREEE